MLEKPKGEKGYPAQGSGERIVDLPKIAQLMEASGFKNVTMSSEFGGIQFQVVGEAKIGLQKMPTLVRVVDVLDELAAKRVAEEFVQMHKKKHSYVFGTFFLYCLLSGKKDQQATDWLIDTLLKETHGIKDTLGGGGGHFLIADEDSGWGFILESKEGVVRFEKRMIDVLVKAGIVHRPKQPPG